MLNNLNISVDTEQLMSVCSQTITNHQQSCKLQNLDTYICHSAQTAHL